MPQISSIQHPVQAAANRIDAPQGAQVPATLRNARPSTGAIVGRVIAGIFTLGISEGIIKLYKHCQAKSAAASRLSAAAPDIPQTDPTVDQKNSSLANKLNKGLDPAHAAAVREALDELRTAYGQDIFPGGDSFEQITSADDPTAANRLLQETAKAVRESATEVSPQDLKNLIKAAGTPIAADMALQSLLSGCGNDTPLPALSCFYLKSKLESMSPEIAAQIKTCSTRAEIATLLASCEDLRPFIQQEIEKRSAYLATEQSFVSQLARLAGTSEERMRAELNLDDFMAKTQAADAQLFKEVNGQPATLAQFREKYAEVAQKLIADKQALCRHMDELGLSGPQTSELKSLILTKGLQSNVLVRLESAIRDIRTDQLEAACRSNKPWDIYYALKALGKQITQNIAAEFTTEDLKRLGPDAHDTLAQLAGTLILSNNPELYRTSEVLGQTFPPNIAADRLAHIENSGFRSIISQIKRDNDPEQIQLATQVEDLHHSGVSTLWFLQTGERNEALAELLYSRTALCVLYALDAERIANARLADAVRTNTLDVVNDGAVRSAIADLRANFGEQCLPPGNTLEELARTSVGKDIVAAVAEQVRRHGDSVSPEKLKELVISQLKPKTTDYAVQTVIERQYAEMGLNPERATWARTGLMTHTPELRETLSQAKNLDEVRALLNSRPEYENILRREAAIEDNSRAAFDAACARLSAALNTPPANVPNVMNLYKLRDRINILARALYDEGNANPDGSVHDIEGRFQAVADNFVDAKLALLESVENLNISDTLRANWRNEVLSNISLQDPLFLGKCQAVGNRMHGTALMTALRDGVPSSQLTGLLKSIGAQIDEYAHQVFTQAEYAKMGSDETSLIARYSREIFVDNNRELVRSMKANPQLMDELRTALEEEMEQVSTELVRCRLDQMPQLQRNFAHIDGALQIIHTISDAQ